MHPRFLPVAFLGVLLLPLTAFAQASTQPLTVDISPLHPRPYDIVTVTPSSNLIDLSASMITVSVNGKAVAESTGAAGVPVQVGALGEATTIKVTAKTGGQTYSATEVVRPADVSLVVEPSAVTHPFYAGGALVAPQGRLRIIALADLRTSASKRLNPADLTYTWQFGDQTLQGESGIGRSILSASAPFRYRDAQITVTVASPDGSLVGEASTVISPVDPVIRIYQVDPLMGPLFERALSGSFTMTNTETTFEAVPYYFGQLPLLSWTLNSVPQSTGPTITARENGAGSGSASLSVNGKDDTALTSAQASLSVLFGKSATNIFGF